MRTRIVFLFAIFLSGFYSLNAQNSCNDTGRYVNSKNTGQTGLFTLQLGNEESAAQTYEYSALGVVNGVRIMVIFLHPLAGCHLQLPIIM